ncbi:lipopolysaccharide assembly protein LapA domain-containing protein [Aeromicrobium sp. UC242_57]|uniref:lipopolysaccharide assembly protein LapA domain-containing protein n=1 Tax=Aeromicrobium sp. UC242_57 TaxID=3374624 RepID=UPI00379BCE7E
MSTPSSHKTPLITLIRERWIAIVLVVLTVLFIVQNRNQVDINLFWIHVRMSLWLVLFVMAAIGAAIGYLASRRRHR